jgi:putative spermidine/putrescine transport system substrate-binding protein
MTVRALLAAAVPLVLWPLAAVRPADARDLSVMLLDRDQVPAWQSVFVKPFTLATGIPANAGAWSGGLSELTRQIKSPTNPFDLVMVNSGDLAAGCAGGAFEKLDWSQIGGRDHYLPSAVSDCGVGATVGNLVLAWDRTKLNSTPTWADFWDVTKFPGKRGLHQGVRGNLEIALMADGVAAQDVYKVLSTSDGVDRAFRKLDQLRPYIVWWNSPEDAARILASGDVLMTSAASPEIVQAARKLHRDFGLQWAGSLYEVLSWAVAKGTPNARAAIQFLYFSGTPAIEGRLVAADAEGGLAKGANEGLPPDLAAISPTAAGNLQAGLQSDAAFWEANFTKLNQRFQKWMEQH